MAKKKQPSFEEEYNRLNKEIEEQLQKGGYAQGNIDNIIRMILIPHYRAEAEMKWQKEYSRTSPEFKEHVEYDVNSAKLWIDSYVSGRKALETRRPFNNPDDPAWNVVEDDVNFAKKNYPDIEKSIGDYVTDLTTAFLKHEELTEELRKLIDEGTPEPEKPAPDASTEIANIEKQVEVQVKEATTTPTSDGHTYPVALVQGWTNEISNYNKQVNGFMSQLDNINFNKVDRTWLKKQVQKFVTWLMTALDKLRKKIVNGLKGIFKPIKKQKEMVAPITSIPTDPVAVVTWAGAVVNSYMEPYTKIIQFITDFMKYTPPLIKESGTLAGNVTLIPPTLIGKLAELTGEGADLIKEEIANSVSGLSFKPVSMGDVM